MATTVGLPVATLTATSAAANTSCTGNGTILVTDTAGNLKTFPVTNPGLSSAAVSGSTAGTTIGTGFTPAAYGKVFGGPNGYIYAISAATADAGTMYMWHWTGTTFDVKKRPLLREDGSTSTGWSFYSTTGRNRISTDKWGHIYHYNTSGQIKVQTVNVATGRITQGDHVLLEAGSTYEGLTASGDGRIYARLPAAGGAVDVFDYDPASDRWMSSADTVNGRSSTGDLHLFPKGLFSLGGDVLVGIQADGTLWHVLYDKVNVLGVPQWRIGWHQMGSTVNWGSFTNVSAFTSTCNEPLESSTPAVPVVAGSSFAPVSVAIRTGTPGSPAPIDYGYVDNIGRLVTIRQTSQDFPPIAPLPTTVISGAEAYSGSPAMAESPTGTLWVQALNRSSHVQRWLATSLTAQTPGTPRWNDKLGIMAGPPTSIKVASRLIDTFATDETGTLFVQRQVSTTGEHTRIWEKLGLIPNGATPLPVKGVALGALDADRVAIATVTSTGNLWVGVYTPGNTTVAPAWTNLGGSFTGTPSVVVAPGFLIRVVARSTTGDLQTKAQALKNGAYPATWTTMGTAPVALSGSPSALLSPSDGLVTAFSRGADGGIWAVQESGQACGTFGTWWQTLPPGFSTTGSFAADPTAFAVTANNVAQWGFATYDTGFNLAVQYRQAANPPAPTGCLLAAAARSARTGTAGRAIGAATHPTFITLHAAAPPR